jgi:hypothetical protein
VGVFDVQPTIIEGIFDTSPTELIGVIDEADLADRRNQPAPFRSRKHMLWVGTGPTP